MKSIFICILILMLSFLIPQDNIYSQDVNIVKYLKAIEIGDANSARQSLVKLKQTNPEDPSVQFLDAILTRNGDDAVEKYKNIYLNHPKSQYADASLYRVFSYYYSLGIYKKAERYLLELKEKYPLSPYLKTADRSIPNEDEIILPSTVKPDQKESKVIKNKYKYTVQAGAFINISNAKILQNIFIQDGYFSTIQTKDVGATILNVVVIGRFIKKHDAGPILDYLNKEHSISGRIIPLD